MTGPTNGINPKPLEPGFTSPPKIDKGLQEKAPTSPTKHPTEKEFVEDRLKKRAGGRWEPVKPTEQSVDMPNFTETAPLFRDHDLKNPKKEGKILTATFYDDQKKKVLEERVERVDTVIQLIEGLEAKKAYLLNKINKLSLNQANPTATQQQKNFFTELKNSLTELLLETERQIDLYTQQQSTNDATWASTNTPRFAFRNLGKDLAKKAFAPVLINLRKHLLFDANGKTVSSINRSGAVSDFAHGEISLKELEDYPDLQKLVHGALNPDRTNQLSKLYDLKNSEGFLKHDKLAQLVETLKQKAIEGYGEEVLNASKTDLDMEKLKQIVAHRTEHLTSQVLQDLVSHFETKPASGPQTIYGRVSLLDATKKAKNEYGFIMNERTQCLDMKAIYDKLDGATIVFDVNTSAVPFVDESGIIHMPKNCADSKIRQTTLKTIFTNISGQGNTRNYGIQKEINREALEKLGQLKTMTPQEKESYEHLKTLLEMLDAKFTMMDSFKVAAQLTEFMYSLDIYMSVNCYGGKDRTTYLQAKNTHLHLKKMLKAQYNQDKRVVLSRKDRALLKRWNLELLNETSVAAGIVQDNAGHTIIKLSRFDLELYEITTVKGLATRIQDLTRAGKLFAYGKQTSISKTPGQLYKTPHLLGEAS